MYGAYNKIYNYLWIFAFLADLGLYTIAIREITENKKKTQSIIGNILSLRCILWVGILFLALFFAFFLPWYNSFFALTWIFIVSIFTIISLINSAILALMQSYMKMEFSFISVILGKILNIILVFFIVFFLFPSGTIADFELPLLFIFCAGLAGILLNTFLNYFYAVKSIVPIRFVFDKKYIRYIFRISLPYGLALFLGVVYFKVDVILLSLLEPQKTADISIALYSLPMKIVEVLMVLGGFYLNSILPSLTKSFQKWHTQKIQKLLDISLKILLSFGLWIFVFGTLLRENMIRIIANQEYISSTEHMYSSSDVFSIVLAVLLFHFISLIFIYVLIAVKKQSRLLKINIFVTIINIVWNIILIPHYSFLWAGITTVMSQVILLLLWYFSIRDIIKIRIDFRFLLFIFLLSAFFLVFGNYSMLYVSFGLVGDVFLYGWALWGFYTFIIFMYLRKSIHL